MIELSIQRAKPVNVSRLHEELAGAIGERFIGVSTGPAGIVRVHLGATGADAAEPDRIKSIVEQHDEKELTVDQARAAERAALWERLHKPWAEWTADDKDTFLRALAEQAGLRVE